MGLGLLGMLVLMFSGGIAAMGNTMFPPQSLQAGLAEDFSAQAHPLIRLRILHPFLAIGVGLFLWLTFAWTGLAYPVAQARRFRKLLVWVYGLQLIVAPPIWRCWGQFCFSCCTWVWPCWHLCCGPWLHGRP